MTEVEQQNPEIEVEEQLIDDQDFENIDNIDE